MRFGEGGSRETQGWTGVETTLLPQCFQTWLGRGGEGRDAQDGTGVASIALGAAQRRWGWAVDTKERHEITQKTSLPQMNPHPERLR